jgi:hypothetical protein
MANTPQPGKSTFKGESKVPAVKMPARVSLTPKALSRRQAVSPMSAGQKARAAKALKAFGG